MTKEEKEVWRQVPPTDEELFTAKPKFTKDPAELAAENRQKAAEKAALEAQGNPAMAGFLAKKA